VAGAPVERCHLGLGHLHGQAAPLGRLDILGILPGCIAKEGRSAHGIALTFPPQGYNTDRFDLPYLLTKADTLGIDNDFSYLGRIRRQKTEMRDAQFQSKGRGRLEYKEISLTGRILFDMMVAIKKDYKLRSYKLDSVSERFLGERKEDVHHTEIAVLWRGSDADRLRLASYCQQDALLPQRLMDKLSTLTQYIEMARVCRVPLNYLLYKGQQIKVVAQLLPMMRQAGYLMPYIPIEESDEKYAPPSIDCG